MDDSSYSSESRNPNIFTISDLTEEIKKLLENHFDFIWVEAEISNFSSPTSGHYYMILKDEKAQIRAVMFRPQVRYLKFRPEDGIKVLAQGRVGVYQPRGEYQIILDYIEPLGVGALGLAYEQLKKKLAAKGLFDKEKKRPLPFLPQKVVVITSPTGAAIQDFLKIIHRRFANIEITIFPVKVQGDEAASEIIEALNITNRELNPDVIVLTRGGGSMEDLWAFNNEELAYTIRSSRVPVVSAVGHEIDTTICDFVADYRAPTPSAAAEILVEEKASLEKDLKNILNRMESSVSTYLNNLKQILSISSKGLRDPRRSISDSWLRLDDLRNYLLRLIEIHTKDNRNRLISENRTLLLYSPLNKIARYRQSLQIYRQSLLHAMSKKIKAEEMRSSLFKERLHDLNPLSVLKRGYSITRQLPEKTILKNTSSVSKGDRVNVILANGSIDCNIEKIHHD